MEVGLEGLKSVGSRNCSQGNGQGAGFDLSGMKTSRRQEMRFTTSSKLFALLVTMALVLSGAYLFAQETTGGLQGTVKDASGAVVAGAKVEVK